MLAGKGKTVSIESVLAKNVKGVCVEMKEGFCSSKKMAKEHGLA